MRPEQTTGELLRAIAPAALFVAVLYGSLFVRDPAPSPTPPGDDFVELRGETMGTTFVVKAVGASLTQDVLAGVVSDRLAEIDVLMSTWRDDSELSRFNASGTEPFTISQPTAEVLALSGTIHDQSGGAFDVTVGPLVQRWGFGPDGPTETPSEDELAALRERVGFSKLTLEGTTLRKAAAGVQVDLSAVAKGYGVDRVAEAVAELDGVTGVMVEIGGEMRVVGPRGPDRPWLLAVERPDEQRRTIYSVLELDQGALATSGDYRRFIDDAGTRRTHVLDPRTGRPVDHGIASASVLAPDCATADAWATALMVLAPDTGLTTIEALDGVEAMVMVRTPNGLDVRTTPGFEAALQPAPEAR